MDNHEPAVEIEKQDAAKQSRKADIARQALDMEFTPQSTDIPVSLDKATKLPLAEIASLGTAFASLPETFRTVTQTVSISGESLLRATDASGNPLDLRILQALFPLCADTKGSRLSRG